MAQCATTALAGAVPRPCVHGARGRFGGLGPVPGVVSLPFPPSRPACPALPVAGCPVRVFLPSLPGTPFHAVCAFRELGPDAILVVPACPLRVCALALSRRPLPPPLGGVVCAPRAIPALGAGRAVPRGPCPSVCPAPVPCSIWHAWGGWSGPGSPLPGLGLCAPRGTGPRGWPATDARGVWCQALSLPGSPALWAGRLGPPPTCCGRGCAGVGARHCPLGPNALWELRAAGVVGGHPRGGRPATVVRGVWCQTLSLPEPPALWGR